MSFLTTSNGTTIHYKGPDRDKGPLPALIYFALSANSTLNLDPFNQPINALSNFPIRTFSWDLPFHNDTINPKESMEKWSQEAMHRPEFIQEFIEQSKKNIDYLIDHQLIDSAQIAVAGLSRGAYVASYLAAEDERIQTLLGFAPLTQLRVDHPNFPYSLDPALSLVDRTDRLTAKTVRFYIGNRDVRVGTDLCFSFVHKLVNEAYHKGFRSPPIELIIYPSIGHKGHGTPQAIFLDGAEWIKKQLIK